MLDLGLTIEIELALFQAEDTAQPEAWDLNGMSHVRNSGT